LWVDVPAFESLPIGEGVESLGLHCGMSCCRALTMQRQLVRGRVYCSRCSSPMVSHPILWLTPARAAVNFRQNVAAPRRAPGGPRATCAPALFCWGRRLNGFYGLKRRRGNDQSCAYSALNFRPFVLQFLE
jgi:hypothetical protein